MQIINDKQPDRQLISISDHQYSMFIHISLITGIILPIVLWLIKKDSSSFVNENGKIVINWILSALIYAVIGSILTFLFIGIIILAAVGVCTLVFLIIGAMKANNGELWPYPLSINFIK